MSTTFAHLSKPQCWGLVLWSAGIALTGAAGLAQISALLSVILGEREQTVFQRLREWYLDTEQKTGEKRQELDVTSCFAPLLAWVLRLLSVRAQAPRRLALALDATSLRNQWTVLSVSVLVAGCAIPVAWKVLPAEQPGSWRPHWESLLNVLGPSVPREWEVLVLADRGLYARWRMAKPLWRGDGIHFYGSMWAAKPVRSARSTLRGSATGCRPLASAGTARWSVSLAKPVDCKRLCSCSGSRVMKALGSS